MKNFYQKPQTETFKIESEDLLTGVVTSTSMGFNSGETNNTGGAGKQNSDDWDDED